jgi:ABC-type multidrug transport system ATPase subunit/pSer/pThr/pTyr-binding forkhead associated (FHA) protein
MADTQLRLVVDGRVRIFEPADRVVVGRDAGADVELAHPEVSRLHAVLEQTAAGWTLTDVSRNGTFHEGRRISKLTVSAATSVSLGSPNGVRLTLIPADAPGRSRTASAQGRLSSVHQVRSTRITIGRLPDNDVVLDDLLVSRRHAELRRTVRGWELTDLGSGNGTFVNGRRVGTGPVTAEDIIGIGRGLLQLQDDRLVAYVDAGDNAFQACGLTVTTAQGKTLLHSVDFALSGQSLLAVIGPSGAGKSTLLAALVGSRPADHGEVHYAGRSLYTDYEELRHRIALVPQDDVLHTQLRVREALTYAAQLRFPADTTADERQRRVDDVLAELGLTEQAEQAITSLSGGQRKRTSVALELLTKPSLLFLDEPTSGLDPGKDRSVMHTLRTLADDARTVVVVTHNVTNLEVCDRLLLLATGGWVAYFGPPAEALEHFEQPDFADIFLLLDQAPGEYWAELYRRSPLHNGYLGSAADRLPDRHSPPPVPGRIPHQQGSLAQLAVLCRRYLAVIASDRQYMIFLAALPLVLSLLARAVPGTAGLSVAAAAAGDDPQPGQLLLVLVIGAALMGAAASVRELVKERPIYRRERAIGLSLGAYLASKVLVLTAVCGLQAIIFTALSLLGRNAPDDPLVLSAGHLEILGAILGVTVTTMLIGLAISALIDNADRGMPLLVLMVMTQLIFSGGLFAVHGRPVLEQLAWLAPARWAFAMTASTTDLGAISRGAPDPLWYHSVAVWGASAALLAGMAVALAAFTGYRLTVLDPRRREGARQ